MSGKRVARVLGKVALGVLAVLVLLLIWGAAIEPRLIIDTERQAAPIRHLPPGWEGQRVAFITDLQVGMWLDNVDTIEDIVARLVRERPALVLLGGDYVYLGKDREGGLEAIRHVQRLLRPLGEAGIPVVAVLGNHDYAQFEHDDPPNDAFADTVTRALEEIGIRVLRNEAVALPPPGDQGEPLYVVGIGAEWPGHARPAVALSGVPEDAARIVLMHNPNTFDELPPGSAPLAVAGHTHGGQVRIPLLPQWTWLTFVRADQVHTDGWIPTYGAPGNRLYVNRGIGFSTLPIRINCPPELTFFTLQAAESRPVSSARSAAPRRR